MKANHHQRRIAMLGLVVPAMLAGGCLEGGILITPVSAKKDLVEDVLMRDSIWSSSKIALIDVSGLILNAPEPRLIGTGEHSVSLLLEKLDKARRDDAVKAVILRINSPGGAVVASELMHAELMHFKKVSGKPVIALMMDVAASGGYYIACACDEIVAQRSTVTGSIGVIMQMFDLTGTMKLIGVGSEAITSGARKDAGSPFRALKPEEREIFQGIVNQMFDQFVETVNQGRPKLDEQAVRRLADGRVYSAPQALENGLIDRIATMRETIESVKTRIGLSSVSLVTYHRPLAYRPNYYSRSPGSPANQVNIVNVDLPHAMNRIAPRFMYLWSPGT